MAQDSPHIHSIPSQEILEGLARIHPFVLVGWLACACIAGAVLANSDSQNGKADRVRLPLVEVVVIVPTHLVCFFISYLVAASCIMLAM